MYNAYTLPHLTYADSVWGTCTQGKSSGLEHLQNYAARSILRRRVGASATDMRQELNWPTLASRRAVSEAVAFSKVSLVVALPICLHYSSRVQEPINMPPGLPPAEASMSLK